MSPQDTTTEGDVVAQPQATVALQGAQLLLWSRKYGFQTAVLLLLAQATGLLGQVTSQIGGMC